MQLPYLKAINSLLIPIEIESGVKSKMSLTERTLVKVAEFTDRLLSFGFKEMVLYVKGPIPGHDYTQEGSPLDPNYDFTKKGLGKIDIISKVAAQLVVCVGLLLLNPIASLSLCALALGIKAYYKVGYLPELARHGSLMIDYQCTYKQVQDNLYGAKS